MLSRRKILNWEQYVSNQLRVKNVRAMNARRAHNIKKLFGGAYIANGATKCVVDMQDQDAVCIDNQIVVDNPDKYVKIVLPRVVYYREGNQLLAIRQAVGDPTGLLTHGIADSVGVCTVASNVTRMIDVKNQKARHCGVKPFTDKAGKEVGVQLVMVVVNKVQPFPTVITKQNVHLIYDVLHALYQFERHEYMHLDVKHANIMVENNVAKLIDFGWSRTYNTMLQEPNDIMANRTYPYWPCMLSTMSRWTTAEIEPLIESRYSEVDEIMMSFDKFGFAKTLMQTGHKTHAFEFQDMEKPRQHLFQKPVLRKLQCTDHVLTINGVVTPVKPVDWNKWDYYYDYEYYTWEQIYDNLQEWFGVKGPALKDYYVELKQRHDGAGSGSGGSGGGSGSGGGGGGGGGSGSGGGGGGVGGGCVVVVVFDGAGGGGGGGGGVAVVVVVVFGGGVALVVVVVVVVVVAVVV